MVFGYQMQQSYVWEKKRNFAHIWINLYMEKLNLKINQKILLWLKVTSYSIQIDTNVIISNIYFVSTPFFGIYSILATF